MDRRTDEHPPAGTIALGYLARNLPFLTRVLRAFIRSENASFYRDLQVEPGEIAILNLIGINPGLSQNELAAAVVIKKSAVTKIVKQLEARGFLERRKGNADRRYNALTLTPSGEAKRGELVARMAEQQDGILSVLSPRERDQLFTLLNRLLERLAERNERGPLPGSGAEDDTDHPPG